MNVLANDGISQEGVEKLTASGFNTILESVDQENIIAVSYTHLTLPTNREV